MPAPKQITTDSQISVNRLYLRDRKRTPGKLITPNNKVCFIGEAVRGPVGVYVEPGSNQRMDAIFGLYDYAGGSGGTILNLMRKAIAGKTFAGAGFIRAAAAAATASQHNAPDVTPTTIAVIKASSVGAWSVGYLTYDISNASDGNANHWKLTVYYLGRVDIYDNLDTTTGNNNLLNVIGTDYANLVVVTKSNDGRPLNATGVVVSAGTAGTDGSIADADFTGTGKGMEIAAGQPGVEVVIVAERSSAALRSKLASLASASSDRFFGQCADASSDSIATNVTDAAVSPQKRLFHVYNWPSTLDDDNASLMETQPTSWVASLFSLTDSNIHLADADNRSLMGGIRALSNETITNVDSDMKTLNDGNVIFFEKYKGFGLVNAVATDGTKIATTRMKDELYGEFGNRLDDAVNKPNTRLQRLANKATLHSYLNGLWKAGRIVGNWIDPITGIEDETRPGFLIDTESLNTTQQRALGIEKILVLVNLQGFMERLVVEGDMEVGLVISELGRAAA